MRFLPTALVVVALAARAAPAAAAAPCDNPAVSPCVDADTFWPAPGASRFVSVGSPAGLRSGSFSAGLVLSYAARPLVLAIPSPGPNGSDSAAIEHLSTATVLLGYGVTDALALELAVPATPYQSGAGLSALTGGDPLAHVALRDLRFGASLALVGGPRALLGGGDRVGLGARFTTSAPTGDESQLAGDRGAVLSPSLLGSLRFGRFDAGLEVGARVRPPSTFTSLVVGSQLLLGLAAGYDVLPRRELLQVSAEARALVSLVPQNRPGAEDGPAFVPAEWLAGVRSRPLADAPWALELGGGGALPLSGEASATTPAVRIVLGLRYTPEPVVKGGAGS